MTIVLKTETRFRKNARGPIDYDASDHVAIAACNVLRRPVPQSAAARNRISSTVHWGYGSAVAVTFEALRRATGSDARATVLFDAGCQAMAFTLFPTLGETPPPWAWDRAALSSSLAVHAIYAVTVAQVARRIRSR